MSSSRKHDWLQNKIYEQPSLVGINPSCISQKSLEEQLLYRGQLYVVPDIKLMYNSGLPHFLEIKSQDSEYLYKKGMSQLNRIHNWAKYYNTEIQEPIIIMPDKTKPSEEWIDELYNLKYYTINDSYLTPRYF